MKALIQTGSSLSACGHAQAGGRVPVPLKSDFLSKVGQLAEEVPDAREGLDRRIRLLERCLEKLAPQARRMVRMRYYEELKPSKIAEELGLSVNGVSVLLSRSRARLRDCVGRAMAHGE